ncbi:GNAT family N-acetyltransferase [Ferrimonas senticii]|uniref:GNAT family N-acetyltransferase n=1 Tax=Ferrimonas senticii TaxID=394566 RepID=UPI0003FF23A8|nr:GNAT family N-acetyltransferase [Ferrimonas senticii]
MDQALLDSATLRPLRADDLRLANSVLLNAYHDDPFFKAVLPQDDYSQRLRAALREELHELWQRQQPLFGIFAGDSLIAVACLLDQHYPLGQTRFWNWRLKMALGSGWKPARQWMAREQAVIDQYQLQSSWLLQFIAVAPSYQHHGFAEQLLPMVQQQAAVNRVEKIATLVYRPELFPWFRRHGFLPIFQVNEADVTATVFVYGG